MHPLRLHHRSFPVRTSSKRYVNKPPSLSNISQLDPYCSRNSECMLTESFRRCRHNPGFLPWSVGVQSIRQSQRYRCDRLEVLHRLCRMVGNRVDHHLLPVSMAPLRMTPFAGAIANDSPPRYPETKGPALEELSRLFEDQDPMVKGRIDLEQSGEKTDVAQIEGQATR